MFAWLDRPDAHGTVAEISYAVRHGLPVFGAFATAALAREAWFPRMLTSRAIVGKPVRDAWAEFCVVAPMLLRAAAEARAANRAGAPLPPSYLLAVLRGRRIACTTDERPRLTGVSLRATLLHRDDGCKCWEVQP